jgi:putative membrane protein
MKKLFITRNAFLIMGLITWSFFSCKDAPKPEDTKETAEDKNEAQFEEKASEKDEATFFVDIAEIDLAEIETAKLAHQKATNLDVKKYAEMLVTDHTKSSAELQKLADNRQLSLPTSVTDDGKEKYNNLNKKLGLDFDKEFINTMIEDHEKAIKKMEDASKDNDKDQSVKVWASNKIANLTAHLQKAKMLKEKLDKK